MGHRCKGESFRLHRGPLRANAYGTIFIQSNTPFSDWPALTRYRATKFAIAACKLRFGQEKGPSDILTKLSADSSSRNNKIRIGHAECLTEIGKRVLNRERPREVEGNPGKLREAFLLNAPVFLVSEYFEDSTNTVKFKAAVN